MKEYFPVAGATVCTYLATANEKEVVIPAKAGIHAVFGHRTAEAGAPFDFAVAVQLQRNACREAAWIPAFAGMTMECLAASARWQKIAQELAARTFVSVTDKSPNPF